MDRRPSEPTESLSSALNEIQFLKAQNKSLMTENGELKKDLINKDKALERAKTAACVLGYALEEWKTRCEVMEKGLAPNIFLLQEFNTKLQEQEQVLTSQQVEVSRLQKELQEKTGLLNREIQKRRVRSKAHVETLHQLSLKETQLNRIEGQWKSRCDALEESNVSKSTQLQELNSKLQEQEQVLTSQQVEMRRLKEKLNHSEHLLTKAVCKRRFNTKDHVDTLDQSAQTEQELRRSSCDAPEERKKREEESHVSNSTQLQELNAKLQEQEQVLTSQQVEVSRLQEELQEKTGLLNREIQKRRARTKAHVETLHQLSLKETQLNRIEGQWKSRCDALEESNASNSTQLQELNTKLQEQEQVLTSRQVEMRLIKEKLNHSEHLLTKAVWKRRFNTNDHVDTLDQSAQTEQELRRTSCDAPEERKKREEENHVSNSTQLQELNAKLQEQEQVLTSQQVEVSRLQEELQEKTGLLNREIQKRRARTKAHVETLHQLSLKETQLNRIEGQWKSRCDALEESNVSKSTQPQELNTKLQEQEQVLTSQQVEMRRLKEKQDHNEHLLKKAVWTRRFNTNDHVDTLDQSAQTEQELRRTSCDAPEERKKREEESRVSNSTQLQELNTKLQEQEQVLTSQQVEMSRLKEKQDHNEHLLKKAVWKRRFNTKDHVDTLDQSAQTEQELRRTSCDAPEERKKREEESAKTDNDVKEIKEEGKSGEKERKHTKCWGKRRARGRNS